MNPHLHFRFLQQCQMQPVRQRQQLALAGEQRRLLVGSMLVERQVDLVRWLLVPEVEVVGLECPLEVPYQLRLYRSVLWQQR